MAASIGAGGNNTTGGSSSKKKENILIPEGAELPSNEIVNEKGNVPPAHVEYHITISRNGVVLHPQPIEDALDPLSWSAYKKNSILAIVMYLYFMFTYITTTTVPSFAKLQQELNISYAQVNWTVAIPALGLAVGPLFWSSLSDIYGRRLIFIIGTLIALISSVGAAVARKTYGGYMVARFFQGFGVSPGATVGMAVVNDMFFDYERGQKLGLWVLAIDTGLLVGPILGGFLDLVSSAWIQWFTAILFAVLLLLELAFMSETLYPRNYMLSSRMRIPRMPVAAAAEAAAPALGRGPVNHDEQFEKKSDDHTILEDDAALERSVKRTKQLNFLNIRPVPGMRHPKPWDSIFRFIMTFKFPVVVIAVGIYCFAWYWWILSIITMLPAAYLFYPPHIQGLLFLGLLLGTFFAELFCSGKLSDSIINRLTRKNNGIRTPEMRLWLAYPAALLSAVGLILWGISIDKAYHWIVGQVAFFAFAAGIQIGNTVITAYLVDSYPLQSMSVITFYSVFLNLSAFINPFFIAPWQTANGWTWSFAAQGILTFFLSVPSIALLHRFGPMLRNQSGQMGWANPEYDQM